MSGILEQTNSDNIFVSQIYYIKAMYGKIVDYCIRRMESMHRSIFIPFIKVFLFFLTLFHFIGFYVVRWFKSLFVWRV